MTCTRLFCSIVLLIATTACMSKGFMKDEMYADMNQKAEVTDRDIDTALKAKPQLPKQFTLAVYLDAPRKNRYNETRWMWTDKEQQMIDEALQPLKQSGAVKQIAYIPPSLAEGGDMKAIRLAAAQHGADAVLVVKGLADIDSFNNALSYTYILLVPALFIPGNHAKSLFISQATMWDVRNEFLYMTAEGDAESDQVRPAAFIDKEELVSNAKTASVKLLAQKLKEQAEHFSEHHMQKPAETAHAAN